jgi:hypothetical protein
MSKIKIVVVERALAQPFTHLNTEGAPSLVSAFFADTEPALSEAEGAGILTSTTTPIWLGGRGCSHLTNASCFFITFLLYAHHRHPTSTLRKFFESAASRSVPVSRDGFHFHRSLTTGGVERANQGSQRPSSGAMGWKRRRYLPLDTIYPTSEAGKSNKSRKSLFRNTLI